MNPTLAPGAWTTPPPWRPCSTIPSSRINSATCPSRTPWPTPRSTSRPCGTPLPARYGPHAVDAGGRLVGSIAAFRKDNIHARSAEIGYNVAEPHWGKGYGTSAVRQLAALLLASSDLLRLSAEVFAGNIASCRVLEKAGFSCEGVLRAHAVKNGHIMDMKVYALLARGSAPETRRLADENR